MNINCLALETGSASPSMALSWQGKKICRTLPVGRGQTAQHLLPALDDMLLEVGVQLQQLDALAYGRGPGRFTGLRLGCALVQGLALGSGVKTVGVDSLKAMAQLQPPTDLAQGVLTVVDAHGGEIYWALWERDVHNGEKMWKTRVPSCCTSIDAMLVSVRTSMQGMPGIIGLGDGFEAYPQLITSLHLLAVDSTPRPTAEGVLSLAALSLLQTSGEPPENVRLQYLRDKVALTSDERKAEHQTRMVIL